MTEWFNRRLALSTVVLLSSGQYTSQQNEASVWKFILESEAKHIYSFLNKYSETPKCSEKWSCLFNIETDVKYF